MKYSLWMHEAKGIKVSQKRRLIEIFGSSEAVYEEITESFEAEGIPKESVQALLQKKRMITPEECWCRIEEKGIGFLAEEQPQYPESLRNIVNAPFGLYYIGQFPIKEKKGVAIVGARGKSAYGGSVARILGHELGKRNIAVISGMALGIDTDGHMGALEVEGRTYAVLGCGVDICYPKQNQFLYEQITERGAIISEYPPGTQPKSVFFPARNRIISGLADCVVVVEAKQKSGSLITADFAMEQGKDVYAVPGRIFDPLSGGCNALIRQGAGMITSPEEFVKDMLDLDQNEYVQMDFRKNLLEKEELLVYSLLDFRPIGLGNLVDKSAMSLPSLLEILAKLEGKGMAKELAPNYFVRTI